MWPNTGIKSQIYQSTACERGKHSEIPCLEKMGAQVFAGATVYMRDSQMKTLKYFTYIYIYMPSVPCHRFAACKRSLNLRGSRNLGKITGHLSRPQFHLSPLGSLASLRTYRHLVAKVGTSKGGGKQWETTPKNLPRMQCARAIPVT